MIRHVLEQLILWLAPDHRRNWAQAMQAEMSMIGNSREAIAFAMGCLIACCRFHLELDRSAKKIGSSLVQDRFVVLALFSGLTAGLIGLTYLLVSGAPLTMVIINGTAIVIGLLVAIGLKRFVNNSTDLVTFAAAGGALILLGTAIFGYAIEDARRWLAMGPFFIQTSLLLLPLIAIGFARIQNRWTTAAIFTAAFAMAVQPDRAMAAMLFVAVAIVGLLRPSRLTFSAALFCAVTFAAALLLPDHLPAVPFVDHILWTAFDIDLWVGLALWAGCVMLICPIIFIPRTQRTVMHYTFVSCWIALITAAAVGAYPTPMVGYGASAIIGYFLSLTFLQPVTDAHLVSDHDPESSSEADEAMPPLRTNTPSFAI